jgi:3-dehydroquinate synthase
MKTINVKTEKRRDGVYTIYICDEVICKFSEIIKVENYSKVAILTDENVADLWLDDIKESLKGAETIVVKPGEHMKNVMTVSEIWTQMLQKGMDRKSLLINLGGGVVGDMGGFAASTYMRGIDFLQIPTTLLSQVDASVGGKVGIDFNGVKNLIGAFQQPVGVIIDVRTLSTLPKRELISGFAEVIKHGLIRDKKYLELVSSKKPEEFNSKELMEIIYESCKIKSEVVELDEREGGLRKVLNFGHTIGHAIESISLETESPLLHGEAIAIGMIAEAKISQLQGFITDEDGLVIMQKIKNAGLPVGYKNFEMDEVMKRLKSDKKNVGSKVKWTLLKNIGEAVFDIEVPEEYVIDAIKFIQSL